MEAAVLEALISKGESNSVEFKVAPPRPSELAERLCGFANSHSGGIVVIGVADQSWEIMGVKSESDAIDIIMQASRLCRPPIPILPNQLETMSIRGKNLVIVSIPPNNGTLYQAGGTYWLRRGTKTSPMDTAEVTSFLYQQGHLHWEIQPAFNAELADLDKDKIQAYLDYLASLTKRPPRLSNYIELLLKLKCLVRVNLHTGEQFYTVSKSDAAENTTDAIYPTNAGLLLFGYAPKYHLTQAEIVATYYRDNSGVQRYTDRKTITGTIPEQIDQVESLLRLWTPVGAYVEGFHRVDEPALPLEALREAVVNAVVHRDYSLEGTAVRIFYYPDRIQIHNPGLLPGNISLERLRQGEAPSMPRNPIIASILKDMAGGYMERVGSGIRFMINQMLTLNLPEPEFKEQGEFVITFYKRPEAVTISDYSKNGNKFVAQTQSEQPNYAANVRTAYVDAGNLAEETSATASAKQVPTNLFSSAERRQMAMEYVRQNGSISHKQYRELTGAAETTAIRDLEALIANGSLRKVGSGPKRRYVQ